MQEFGKGTIFLPIVFFARYPKAIIHRLMGAIFATLASMSGHREALYGA